jgi:hypothetical protein
MDELIRKRSVVGKIAAFICILFCLSIADALIAGFRQPLKVFDLLPGSSSEINGFFAEKIESTKEISYTVSSDHIRLSIDSIQKGHWFGDNMWQGQVMAGTDAAAGEYALEVGVAGVKKINPPLKFLIKVHNDYPSYRQSFKSFIKRYLNISPWILSASFISLVIPAFVYIFFLSGNIERQMAKEGKAVVYRVKKIAEGCELSFGLGSVHGIKKEIYVTLFNEKGEAVGTALVHDVSDTDSRATADHGCAVRPGYTVSISGRRLE